MTTLKNIVGAVVIVLAFIAALIIAAVIHPFTQDESL
jgi:hypothetical protein